jgi:hypothetical protein
VKRSLAAGNGSTESGHPLPTSCTGVELLNFLRHKLGYNFEENISFSFSSSLLNSKVCLFVCLFVFTRPGARDA